MIDTHAHIQFKIFDQNRDQVIEEAKKIGIEKIIAVGTNLETSKKALDVAGKYPEVFASVGIHPHHVFEHFHSQIDIRNHLKEIEKLLKEEKVVAVGEIGMDKHDYPNTKYKNYQIHKDFLTLQKELFQEQIKLAINNNKSLIIHNRKAAEETIEVLAKNWDQALEARSVFHMCEPDQRLLVFAKEHYIYISFGGDVTYDSDKQEFLKKVPLELLVLETDSPFFTPEPPKSQGVSPNTPANLKIILEKVAEILKIDQVKIEEITFENSKRLFKL